MTHDVFGARLAAQGICEPWRAGPATVVERLLAVQTQDFVPGLWSVAQRLDPVPTMSELGAAFDRGELLRTHVLRPTWHVVTPRDIRWLLDLTGPRVLHSNATSWPKLGLTDGVVRRGAELLGQRLEEGPATRAELVEHLAAAGLELAGIPLVHVLMWAEMTGVMCSGPRRGRTQTYALLSQRAPGALTLEPGQALAELVVRYVAGHGPTTAKDLRSWSSLPLRDVEAGIAAAGDRVERAQIGGTEYLVPAGWDRATIPDDAPAVTLLQAFDELAMGYRETRGVLDPGGVAASGLPATFEYGNPVLVRGELAGWWRRKERATELNLFLALGPGVRVSRELRHAVDAEHARLSRFYELVPGTAEFVA